MAEGISVLKVMDPVCGMEFEPQVAVAHGRYGAKEVYFCSRACQKAFERTGPPRTE